MTLKPFSRATTKLGRTALAGTARTETASAGTARAGTASAGTASAGTASAGTASAGTAPAGTAPVASTLGWRWLAGTALVWSTLALSTLAGVSSAQAAVTDSQFPPKTVRDLIAICSADRGDPRMTASVNYCHGFAEGAVIVEQAHEGQRGGRKLFCLPTPPPAADAELASFTTWANQTPSRLDMPSIDGMFIYLATKYPCGNVGGTRR